MGPFDNFYDLPINTSIDTTPRLQFLALAPTGLCRIDLPTLVASFPHQTAANATGKNFIVNDTVNSMDATVHSSAILAGGTAGNPNQIGVAFVGETGTYVAGTASYAINISGYDSIVNQIAGVAIGPHHRLHASGDHGACLGGSTNAVKAGSYNICVGGGGAAQGNSIDLGSNSVIAGGLNNVKSGAGNGAAIVGGNGVTISSSGSYNFVGAGQTVTVSGSAQNAAVFGSTQTVTHSFGLTFGTQQLPVGPASLTFGGRNITAQGDCQAVSVAVGVRTTNATLTNMAITSGGTNLQFDNAKTTAFVCKALVVGIDEATKAMASYQGEVCGYWDGTNLYFDDAAAAATGPATSGERNLIAISDNIGVAAVATLALTAGQLRLKVTGKAATNIRWVGRLDLVMTYF